MESGFFCSFRKKGVTLPHHIKQRMTFRRLIFIAIAAIGFRLVLQTCLMSVGLVSGFCSSGQSFAASFFRTLRRRNAVAFGCALPAIRARSGLAPVRTYTCRAYQKREPRSVSLQEKLKKGNRNRFPCRRWAATYFSTNKCSIISEGGLNFSVRNGKR